MKKLMSYLLLGVATTFGACNNGPKYDPSEKAVNKGYWLENVKKASVTDTTKVTAELNWALNHGDIVVTKSEEMHPVTLLASMHVFEGAIVKDTDTLAKFSYIRQSGEYDDKYSNESGKQAFLTETSTITLAGKNSSEPSTLVTNTEFTRQKSGNTLAQKARIY